MAPKRSEEKPTDAFEKLRQSFDILKEKHTDPWNWHEYLQEEPKSEDEEERDPDEEMMSLKPKARSNIDRLKSHLLGCCNELNRAAAAADMCYFHMCCSPQAMRDCCIILGTSGDIDEDMLASGDVSPQKMLAALQLKLDRANAKIEALEIEVTELKDALTEANTLLQERFLRWQESAMAAEEAMTRLHWMTIARNDGLEREEKWKAVYTDLLHRLVRAQRLMKYKGRQLMRDRIFNCNKKENLFYSFHAFIEILHKEKEERVRREHEQERNATEFALRNEVKLLLLEGRLHRGNMEKMSVKVSTMKRDRIALACRIMHKHRPYVANEYLLWVWELWQPVRKQLALEKYLESEQACHNAVAQQLVQTSKQLPPLVDRIEQLRIDVVAERVAHDESRRQLMATSARQLAELTENLQAHRIKELHILARLHEIDVEEREERIAILEREIAEDKHVHALKGMVVDLESNLRKALDRRKQRKFAVLPTGSNLCEQCSRGITFSGWKDVAKSLAHSLSETDLKVANRGISPRMDLSDLPVVPGGKMRPWPAQQEEKSGQFNPVWR